MPEQRSAPAGPPPTLIERLQQVTEALSAANTQDAVFDIVLTPALEAIGAVAGVVLLIAEEDQALHLAATKGHAPDLTSSRQAGQLDHELPAGDALQRHEALFFEDHATLTRAYPALEPRTGTRAPSASAVLPMVLDDRPLGVLVLDFKEPHVFQPDERRFLRTLAAQCSVALGRVALTCDLERRIEEGVRDAEEARRDSELLAILGDALQRAASPEEVATLALPRLGPALQAVNMLVVRLDGEHIRFPTLWGDTPQEISDHMMRPGLVLQDTPLLRQVVDARTAVYADDYHLEPGSLDTIPALAVGLEPICLPDGTLGGCLVIWRPMMPAGWRASEQRVLHRAANTLGLALERAQQAEMLSEKNAELEARTQALEGFADLTRDFAPTTDPLLLISRAQEIVMSLLADGSALYFEPEGKRWICQAQHGTLHSAELQAAVDAGLPYDRVNTLLIPWTTGQPYFQDVYDQTTDHLLLNVGHIGATASLPLQVGGVPIGVLAFALFHQRSWSSVDRVVLETAVQSLELALDRAAKTRTLEEERTALAAFTRFTEAVGSETEVQVLVGQAILLLEETRSVDVTYLEREGELFKVRSWNAAFPPDLLARSQEGFSLDQPSFARASRERQAVFEDHWNAARRGVPEGAVYQALAVQPFFEDGEMTSLLVMGSRHVRRWSERDKGIFRAVGRSLQLALDRARQTETLKEKNVELEARTRTLEGFALLSREFALEHDPVNLVGRAQELILSLLPEGVSTYYELQDDGWHLRSHRGKFQNSILLQTLQGGVPRGTVLNLERPLETRSPFYQAHFEVETTTVAREEFKAIGATAALPVFVNGQVQGVLVFGLSQARIWSAADRAVLETVAHSLGLALERSQATQALLAQRDALDARTQDLAAANQELEGFSYSVSHDLRTPVRHINGFMKLARQALDGTIDAKTTRYLDVVDQSALQLNTLIDALLELSRASRKPLQLTAVDLNEILAQIRDTLLPDLLERDVRWEVQALPTVTGDRDALHGVLTQLIENALKFTRERTPAVIRVWADDLGTGWRVSVGDNGMGFDPQYSERLFNMFQRLHGKEVEGTGVGLANVRRMVLKHGGQVFAEGQVGQGATFGFTLPKDSPAVQPTR